MRGLDSFANNKQKQKQKKTKTKTKTKQVEEEEEQGRRTTQNKTKESEKRELKRHVRLEERRTSQSERASRTTKRDLLWFCFWFDCDLRCYGEFTTRLYSNYHSQNVNAPSKKSQKHEIFCFQDQDTDDNKSTR